MKTKLFTLFLALIAGVGALWASDTSVNGIWYDFDSNTKEASVTYRGSSYNSYSNEYSGAVTIPPSVTYNNVTYKVTSIGVAAFYGCTGLTSITIPNSVTSIGRSAFYGCTGLTSITIPNSVTSIGRSAFYGCTGLTSITIPNSVTSIGDYAFYGCSGLTSITISNSATSIGDYAFYGCTGLTSITIPNSVTSIGYGAFAGCKGLKSITIPNSVTSIAGSAFSGCSGLTSIAIPNSVTSIGEKAFYNCTKLKSVTIGNSVTSIGGSAFSGCSGLTSVIWNAKNCANSGSFGNQVESFVFGNEVESIPGSCCSGMSKLTSITIPNSVTSIGSNAFYGCTGLTSITIPNSVTSIGDYAFYGCSGLTSITIGNSVTSIGSLAFFRCTGLMSVTIPNSVTSIGDAAFAGCTSLTSVAIPNSVTSIGDYAFYGCSGLTSITIPNSVTSIGDYAFAGCKGLKSITIPNSVTSIGECAFEGCTDLTKVTLNSNEIVSKAYRSGSNIGTIFGQQVNEYIIGVNVTSIGNYAFSGCTGLTSITIPNSVTSIGVDAFSGCTGLPVENNLRYADSYLIEAVDKSLSSYTIKEGTKWIGDAAFYGCSGLTSITIPNSVTSIGEQAFNNCTGLTAIYVPCGELERFKTMLKSYAAKVQYPPVSYTVTKKAEYGTIATTSTEFASLCDEHPVTCTVVPDRGFRFVKWSDGNTDNPRTIEMTQDTTIEAFFDYSLEGKCGTDNALTWKFNPSSMALDITGKGSLSENYTYGTFIKSVTIGNEISVIGQNAFKNCTNLTSITIGNSVTSIGWHAFEGCSSLTAIYVPCGEIERFKSMLSKDDRVRYMPSVSYIITKKAEHGTISTTRAEFTVCDEEHLVTCTAVPDRGFRFVKWSDGNTDNPRTIEMTQDTTIEAFFDYSLEGKCGKDNALTWKFNPSSMALDITGKGSLSENYTYDTCIESVTIGNEVTVIGQNAFKNCTNLTNVTIPKSVKTIGEDAFDGCEISEIRFDGTLNYWCAKSWNPINISSEYDLYIADKLITALIVPNGVTKMKEYAFAGCKSLSSVVFPESVTSVENSAFKNCTSLAYAIIPSSVNTIKSDAFSGCSSLKSVTCYRTTPPELSQDAFAHIPSECVLYVLEQSLFVYMNDDVWNSSFREILPIGAVQDYNATDDVKVTPSENTADVVWPQTADAATYELVIKDKNGNVICTLVFNANGQLTQIAFAAPSRINAPAQAQAVGFAFTVTGLESGTAYDLTLTAKNGSGATLNSRTVSFSTQGPTALEDIADDAASASGTQKVMIDGQIYILRDGKIYTLQGAEIIVP